MMIVVSTYIEDLIKAFKIPFPSQTEDGRHFGSPKFHTQKRPVGAFVLVFTDYF